MDNRLKILIVEDDETERRDLVDAVYRRRDNFVLAGATNDSEKALTLCAQNAPDAVVLDLELHFGGGDGLSFLDGLKKLNLKKRPYILVTTNNISKVTHAAAHSGGADFIMVKTQNGYSANYVLDFILNAAPSFSVSGNDGGDPTNLSVDPDIYADKLQKTIFDELIALGFKPSNIAFGYLCEAIFAATRDSSVNGVKVVAENHGKTRDSISRAIQNELNRVWKTTAYGILYKRYTARIDEDRGAPSTAEFIKYYAAKFKLS